MQNALPTVSVSSPIPLQLPTDAKGPLLLHHNRYYFKYCYWKHQMTYSVKYFIMFLSFPDGVIHLPRL